MWQIVPQAPYMQQPCRNGRSIHFATSTRLWLSRRPLSTAARLRFIHSPTSGKDQMEISRAYSRLLKRVWNLERIHCIRTLIKLHEWMIMNVYDLYDVNQELWNRSVWECVFVVFECWNSAQGQSPGRTGIHLHTTIHGHTWHIYIYIYNHSRTQHDMSITTGIFWNHI